MTGQSHGGVLHKLTHPGGKSPTSFARETLQSISEDDIFGRSAQLAYYFFFSIFPGFIFISSLPGVSSGANGGMRASLMEHLASVVPPSAYALLQQTFNSAGGHPGKLTFGAIVALWSATVGMVAACDTLSAVHDIRDTRPWWKVRLVALALTIVTTILLLCAIGVLFVGDLMVGSNAHTGLSGALWVLVKIAQWVVTLSLVALIFGITYYWAPDIKERKWHWITPGAAVGIILWAAATVGLRVYLHYFDSYSATYGTIGAVMILLLWFYIAGLAMLIGAEVNAVIEDTAAREGDPNAIEKGHKRPQVASEVA
jgi:membrane protein